MTKQVDVGLFFGESFYEVIFTERPSGTILFSGSFFNIKDPFKNKFPKLVQNFGEVKIDSVFVSYRYLERIFKYKLGGSVAQVVTKGFENWLGSHHYNKNESLFFLKSAPDLSSFDMIFPVNEKISYDGNVQLPIDLNEVNELIESLKKKEAKRVCLNLVNAHKNPIHHNLLKKILIENQFEVFDRLETSKDSSAVDWRTCLIEASLAGTFNEMRSEIVETLQQFTTIENISFVNNSFEGKGSRNILSGLFALEDAFFEVGKSELKLPDQFSVVHLGLENFSVWLNKIEPWQSPWGATSLVARKRIDLEIQPTNSFHLNSFEDIEISQSEESFEPGPMCLGRGKIPCVYDILNAEFSTPELQKKIRDSFWALARSSTGPHATEKTFDEFKTVIWDRILIESSLLINTETVVFYGDLPPSFERRAKEIFNTKNTVFVSQKKLLKAHLALLQGRTRAN